MAEVGLAAAVAGLISLAIEVSHLSFEYASAVRHTSRSVSGYLRELSALTSVVLRLQDAAERLEVRNALGDRPPGLPNASVMECIEQMKKLKEKLERYVSGSGIRGKVKSLAWPFEEKDTRHLTEMFQRYCSIFDMILSADTLIVSSTTLHEVRALKADDNRRVILEWLSTYRYGRKQAEILERHYAGTGQWLLDAPQYSEWLNGDQSVLWCYGNPGTGKTVMSSFVVDQLSTQFARGNTCIAYHYCDFQDERQQQTTESILRSLLRQMAERSESLPDEVLEMYNLCKESLREPSVSELVISLTAFTQGVILVDALDECRDKDRLISALKQLLYSFKILLTSRPFTDVRKSLSCLSLEIIAPELDIRHYVLTRLQRNEDLDSLVTAGLRESIASQVLHRANGVFLLATLLMDGLDGVATIKQIRDALRRSPINLAEAYQSTFARIMSQSPSRAQIALQVLTWILHSERPLYMNELQHALAVEAGDLELDEENLCSPKILINSCMGLAVVHSRDNTVRLPHLTVEEFLLENHEETVHKNRSRIARVCLTYLLFRSFREAACRTHDTLTSRLRGFPLLDYAACNWGRHAQGELENELKNDILTLLRDENALDNAVQVLHYRQRSDRTTQDSAFEAIPRGFGPLHVAAYWALESMVGLLCTEGVDVSSKDTHGWTPLHWSAARGHLAVVELLMKKGADMESYDRRGWTPIFWAIQRGRTDVALLLLQKGARLDLQDSNGWTPLHFAISLENEAIIRELVKNGADVNISSHEGKTPYNIAFGCGNRELVRLLAEPEVLPDLLNTNENKIETAAKSRDLVKFQSVIQDLSHGWNEGSGFRRHDKIPWAGNSKFKGVPDGFLKYFFEYGDFRRQSFANAVLHNTILAGNELVVQSLITCGGDPKSVYTDGQTYLHTATFSDSGAILNLLISLGVDHTAVDKHGHTALHYAVILGKKTAVDVLSRRSGALDLRNVRGRQAIHILAARNEHEGGVLELVEAFLQLTHIDLNTEDNDGHTPLSIALCRRNWEMARILMKHGGAVREQPLLIPPLFDTVGCGNESAVQLLFAVGAQPNVPDERGEPLLVFATRSYKTLLEMTPETGHSIVAEGMQPAQLAAPRDLQNLGSIIQLLLDHGENVNSQDIEGVSALHVALQSGQMASIASILLRGGADIHMRTRSGRTALHAAAESGHPDYLHMLFKHGADRNALTTAKEKPVSVAAANGYELLVQLFLSEETLTKDPTSQIDWLATAQLYNAIERDDLDRFQELQGRDLAVNGHDKSGLTILHKACWHGNVEMASTLLRLGVEIDTPDNRGWTALHLAAARGHEKIIRFLVENGAKLTTRTKVSASRDIESEPRGASPLHLAAWHRRSAVVEALISLSASTKPPLSVDSGSDGVGRTALMCAAHQGHFRIVRLLLDAGANVNAVGGYGSWGFCAIDLAAHQGHDSLVDLLAKSGSVGDWWTSRAATEAINKVRGWT
ncbi:MAG: hypothetical protein M1813_003281 [Trichoglossum hirsutum]|nr:MAG: hypothetical protein M1813_003281 [Trichoglossum hirsutum]